MKIEKLAEDKIKITITIDDLAERNIDLYSFMYNSPESQDLFWDVMNEAEREYGFNVDDSMICVEASTSGGGNFTLIVTKTKEKPIVKFNPKQTTTSSNKESVKLKRKKMPYFIKNGIYKFEAFDDLCVFCKNSDARTVLNTVLYKYKDSYYLQAGIIPNTLILEYASIVKNPDLFISKLNEYATVLIEKDVIETINEHFNSKKKRVSKK